MIVFYKIVKNFIKKRFMDSGFARFKQLAAPSLAHIGYFHRSFGVLNANKL
jgi:hypothetical protein